jgi:MFS family permease
VRFLYYIFLCFCLIQGIVKSPTGLYINRFFLGLCEGGILPGIILYLSTWHKRRELQIRIGYFWSAASLAGAFGGLLAAAIGLMRGKGELDGWSWIFIIEGIVTVLVGVASFFLITSSPDHSRFLKPHEREYLKARLDHDAKYADMVIVDGVQMNVVQDDKFSWKIVASVYADPQIYGVIILGFTSGTSVYSIAYFLPTILAGFTSIATSTAITQLLTVPPYALAIVTILVACYLSDKYGQRGIAIVIPSLVALVGAIVVWKASPTGVKYFGIFLFVMGVYTLIPAVMAISANNFAGHYRRATSTGTLIVCTNSGGILATWLFTAAEAPNYPTGYKVNISFLVLQIVTALALDFFYMRKNKQRQRALESGNIEKYKDKEGDRHVMFRYCL